MKQDLAVFLTVVWLCLLFQTASAASDPVWKSSISELLTSTIADENISGAVALAEFNGERVVISAGVTSRESQAEIPLDARLRVASVGKLHTAAVIHGLIDSGELTLDDQVSELLDERWTEDVANSNIATIRQLLNHTSGIPDYYDDEWFNGVDTETGNTAVRTLGYVRGRPASFEAGKGYGYSNTNYQYLALVAEAVADTPFEQQMQALISEKLELGNTAYNAPFVDGDVIHGYGSPQNPTQDTYWLRENDGPDGGVFTSADDLADTLQALFAPNGTLSEVGLRMLSEEIDRNNGQTRALGPLRLRDPRGLDIVMHSGSIPGYATFAGYELNTGMTIIVHLTAERPDLATQTAQSIMQVLLAQ